MSAAAVSKAVKPQLRGLLHSQIKRNLIVASVLCAAAGITWRVVVVNVHRQKYADFYRSYDIDKDFNRMRNLGLFDSCEPDS